MRESRRVYEEHRLTKEECINGAVGDDTIFVCGTPIEDLCKEKDGENKTYWEYISGTVVYDVPYKTIVLADSYNAWVLGHCFSATHNAHASCPSMAQTMSMSRLQPFLLGSLCKKTVRQKN